jgi:hypothetical protein
VKRLAVAPVVTPLQYIAVRVLVVIHDIPGIRLWHTDGECDLSYLTSGSESSRGSDKLQPKRPGYHRGPTRGPGCSYRGFTVIDASRTSHSGTMLTSDEVASIVPCRNDIGKISLFDEMLADSGMITLVQRDTPLGVARIRPRSSEVSPRSDRSSVVWGYT